MVTLYVITGPPASGKSTWVNEHAASGDIVIDFDDIAATLVKDAGRDLPPPLRALVRNARQSAISASIPLARRLDVYIIDTNPPPTQATYYQTHGAQMVCIDPGRDVVEARCQAERPPAMRAVVARWYASNKPTQPTPTRAW